MILCGSIGDGRGVGSMGLLKGNLSERVVNPSLSSVDRVDYVFSG